MQSRWRDAALDVSAALFPPTVIVLLPFNAVVFANVEELLYHPTLRSAFLAGGVVLWVVALILVRRRPERRSTKLALALPWTVLLCDVVGAWLEGRSTGGSMILLVDAAILGAVLAAGLRIPWPTMRAVAAAAGAALAAQGTVAHAAFLRDLDPRHVAPVAAAAEGRAGVAADGPGNVYHLLLDSYQSEAFVRSTGPAAPERFPGFTYYGRFNTNFPRTGSSEPSLIHGRYPEPGQSIEGWYARVVQEGFWTDLAAADIGLWIYPPGPSLCHARVARCVTSWDLERESGAAISRDATVDLWALRLLPASLRDALSTETESAGDVGFSVSGAVQRLFGSEEAPQQVKTLPRQFFNLRQFDVLLAEEARRPPRGQYVYYHGLIPHPDFLLDSRCEPVSEARYGGAEYWAFVACANLMVERLAARLEELGRLDEALIVVHADHGDPAFLIDPHRFGVDVDFPLDPIARSYQPPDPAYQGHERFEAVQNGDSSRWRSMAVEALSSGLLLVRHPGDTRYREDSRPVQLFDIAPTILRHFGLETTGYVGIPLSEPIPLHREIVFFAHSRQVDGKLSKYRLTDAGWRFVEDIPVVP